MRLPLRALRSISACAVATAAVAGLTAADGFAQSASSGIFGVNDVQLAAGGIVVVLPRYEGSKQYRVVGLPFIAPGGPETDEDRFHAKGADDLRLRFFKLQNLEIGGLGGWRFGRQEDDADHLRGLDHVSGGLVIGGYAAYHLGPVSPFVSYHHQITGNDTGGILRFGAESKFDVTPSLKFNARAGATWASEQYMQSFFGVTAQQATSSGLPRFETDSQIKDVFIELGSTLRIDDVWTLKISGTYSRLLGDAAHSPITETPDQFVGMLAISYDFRLPLP